MRIIIHDACCLFDLKKANLLMRVLELSHRIAVVDLVKDQEVLNFTDAEWKLLEAGGLEVLEIAPEQIGEVVGICASYKGISVPDCSSFVQAQFIGAEAILLTNDSKLRYFSSSRGVEVHGTLWLLDELYKETILSSAECVVILEAWQSDPFVRLPEEEVMRMLEFYRSEND